MNRHQQINNQTKPVKLESGKAGCVKYWSSLVAFWTHMITGLGMSHNFHVEWTSTKNNYPPATLQDSHSRKSTTAVSQPIPGQHKLEGRQVSRLELSYCLSQETHQSNLWQGKGFSSQLEELFPVDGYIALRPFHFENFYHSQIQWILRFFMPLPAILEAW